MYIRATKINLSVSNEKWIPSLPFFYVMHLSSSKDYHLLLNIHEKLFDRSLTCGDAFWLWMVLKRDM